MEYNKFIYVALSLIIISCKEKDDITDSRKSIKDENKITINNLVRSTEKIPVLVDTSHLIDESVTESEKVEKYRVTNTAQSLVAFDPLADVLYPGSLIQGKSAPSGILTPLGGFGRSSGTVTLLNIGINDTDISQEGPRYSKTIVEPSLVSTKEAAEELLSKAIEGSTAARMSYVMQEMYSLEQGLSGLGISAKWLGGEVRSNLSSSSEASRSGYLVKYTQAFYTLAFSAPKSPADVFADSVSAVDLDHVVSADNPPMYVSSITYGRTLFLAITSSEQQSELEAALKACFGQLMNKGKIEANTKHAQTLRESRIHAVVLGGDSTNATKLLTGNVIEGLNDFLSKGSQYSKRNRGVPISYQLRYLSDNEVARISFTTDYEIRTQIQEPTVKLKVKFSSIDVYLDGSGGKDKWSTYCDINGKQHQIWDRKKDISDNCTKAHGRGPGGDKDCCRYGLTNDYIVEIPVSGELKVKFYGTAHDDNDEVSPSSLTFNKANNWGGNKQQSMGAVNHGQTEYRVHYKVIKME